MIQNHGISSFFQRYYPGRHKVKQVQSVTVQPPPAPQSAASKKIARMAYLITGLNQIPLSLLTIHTTQKEYLNAKNKLPADQIRVLLAEVYVGQGVSTAIYLLSYFGGAPLINWCTKHGIQRLQQWAAKGAGNTVNASAHPAVRHTHKINPCLNQLRVVQKAKQQLKSLGAFIRIKVNQLNASIQDKNNKTLWECIYGVIAGFIGYGYIRPKVKAKIMKYILKKILKSAP